VQPRRVVGKEGVLRLADESLQEGVLHQLLRFGVHLGPQTDSLHAQNDARQVPNLQRTLMEEMIKKSRFEINRKTLN
jgi:hypothetical protein